LRIEAGLFAGNGIEQETDNRRDFIGHISMRKVLRDDISIAGGVSYYNGGVYMGTSDIYRMRGGLFELNSDVGHIGGYARREYLGFDLGVSVIGAMGMTLLRGEYLRGVQPGTSGSSGSPDSGSLPSWDTYLRNFSGFYAILVQDLGDFPLSAVLKYDCYDPNTDISGGVVGLGGTSRTDLLHSTVGFGVLWKVSYSMRLQAYYELNRNETSDYFSDLDDDIFTIRLQYKF
jgi:hypothetical protein